MEIIYLSKSFKSYENSETNICNSPKVMHNHEFKSIAKIGKRVENFSIVRQF